MQTCSNVYVCILPPIRVSNLTMGTKYGGLVDSSEPRETLMRD